MTLSDISVLCMLLPLCINWAVRYNIMQFEKVIGRERKRDRKRAKYELKQLVYLASSENLPYAIRKTDR